MNKIQVALIVLTILMHLSIRYKIKVSVRLRDDGSERIDVDVRPTTNSQEEMLKFIHDPINIARGAEGSMTKRNDKVKMCNGLTMCESKGENHSWKGGDKCLKCGVKR